MSFVRIHDLGCDRIERISSHYPFSGAHGRILGIVPPEEMFMRLDCSSAVLRALAVAHESIALHGDELAPRMLMAALLHDPDGAPALLAASCGLVPGAWNAGANEVLVNEPAQQTISDLAPPLRILVRHAGILFREAFQEGELTTNYLMLAVLVRHPELARELESVGFVMSELEQRLGPPPATLVPVPVEFNDLVVATPPKLEEHRIIDQPEPMARLIDATANRAREALHVVEDHARFVRDNPVLTLELRDIRHELTKVLGLLPNAWLSPLARNIEADLEFEITTAEEMQRPQPVELALRNLKRAQESLRTLEEHSTTVSPEAALALMRLRYRTYAMESLFTGPVSILSRLASARLYFLATSNACSVGFERAVKESIAGGVTVIQSREKKLADREWLAILDSLRRWTNDSDVLLIVNDRPDLALLVEADGVHLGQDDMEVKQARRILGHHRIVGKSTHSLDQFRLAVMEGADYAGVGPVFQSSTKEFSSLAGLDYVRDVAAISGSYPWYALGGIHAGTVAMAVRTGARRVAVSNVLASSRQPSVDAAQLLHELVRGD